MKDFRVSDAANADLKRIIEYTKEKWGNDQAGAVRSRLKETLLMLQVFPGLLSSTDKPDFFIKTIPRLPFVIVCKEDPKEFIVMQILHDKQIRLF